MHDHAAELDALGVRAEPQQDTACLSEDEHAVSGLAASVPETVL